MTLAVPRSSLLRPLNEPELYDPDTPGTTYSFQEQGPSKSSMQSEGPVPMDTSMFMSNTDDEMLDSDSDHHRRDEDFDIDIDAEVYSVNGGDLEITMTMEEESNTYGIVEAQDDDDIMFDDEPDYNYAQEAPPSSADVTASTVTQQDSVSTQSQIALSGQDSSFFQPTSSSPREPVNNPQDPGPVEQTQQDPGPLEQTTGMTHTEEHSTADDSAASLVPQPEQIDDHERDSNDLGYNRASVEPRQEQLLQYGSALEEADNRSQSSTATLTHEIPKNEEQQFLGEGNEHEADNEVYPENEYAQPNHDDVDAAEGLEDTSYWYPVIVQYGQNQLFLFAPKLEWSEKYENLPSDYLLQDDVLCSAPLEELFVDLRNVLGPEENEGSEFVMEIETLGLRITEGSTACKSVRLRRILDLHNQLRQNDGQEIPEPVRISLYTVPSLLSRLDDIAAAVNDGKGLKECLIQWGSQADEDSIEEETAAHVTDIADASEENVGYVEAQNYVPEAFAAEDTASQKQELQQKPEEATGAQPQAEAIEPEADDSGIPESDADHESDHEHVERHIESNSVAVDAYADELLDDTAPAETKDAVTAPVDDEEELLEYEDGNDDQQTIQPDIAVQENEKEREKPAEEEEDDGELLGAEELEPHVDSHESVAEKAASVHGDTEDQAEAQASDADSDQNSTPPNIDDNSNHPSPIPVYDGGDEEGEYDEQQQEFEAQGYDEEGYPQSYEEDGQQGTEADNYSVEQNVGAEQEGLEDAEGYVEDVYNEQECAEDEYQENNDEESGDYYDENQGEYIQEDLAYIEEEQYEGEEYNEAPLENAADETPVEVVVIDPSATEAADNAYISPVASTHEEELIDYEDDEEDINPPHVPEAATSSPTLKRLRDESDSDGDGELDADQATKRARAD